MEFKKAAQFFLPFFTFELQTVCDFMGNRLAGNDLLKKNKIASNFSIAFT